MQRLSFNQRLGSLLDLRPARLLGVQLLDRPPLPRSDRILPPHPPMKDHQDQGSVRSRYRNLNADLVTNNLTQHPSMVQAKDTRHPNTHTHLPKLPDALAPLAHHERRSIPT